jgi:uncharacterized protein YbaR (Trm112 family)
LNGVREGRLRFSTPTVYALAPTAACAPARAEGGSRRPSYNTAVMLSKDLLDILVCPACKQALEYRQNPESLKCTQCHRVYRVEDNIPIMLVDEATIES